VLAGSAGAQSPGTSCSLPVDPAAIPTAIDAAITGLRTKTAPAMKALFLPEARLVVASVADGALTYTVLTLDDWIARVQARGVSRCMEEKQNKVQRRELRRYRPSVEHLCAAQRW